MTTLGRFLVVCGHGMGWATGVQLQLGSAFQCVVAAACLSFCISASAPYVWSIQPLTYIRKDLPEHADEKSDEDLRQVISSTY